MRSLLCINDLTSDEITAIFALADNATQLRADPNRRISAAFSFEGNSIRTRSTFLKALADLGIQAIEIPNLLKTAEPVEHLAGYLDNWFDLYIVRDSDHRRMAAFAERSKRPLINAMTSAAHPCEVLADAYSIQNAKGDLRRLNYCIIGPPTNVLNSWQRLAGVLGLRLTHVLPAAWMNAQPPQQHIRYVENKLDGLTHADIVLTDAWPSGFDDQRFQLQLADMVVARDNAWVIPCPPFNTDNEVSNEIIASPYFAGYGQKAALYPVQKALIWRLLNDHA